MIVCLLFTSLGCSFNQSDIENNVSQSGYSPGYYPHNSDSDISETFYDNNGDIVDLTKIEMKTEFSEYSKDVKEITVIISNHSDYEYSYEAYTFGLQRKINGEWQDVPFKENGDSFPYLAGIINPQSSIECTVDIENHIQLPLDSGYYRIEKDELYAEFIIK